MSRRIGEALFVAALALLVVLFLSASAFAATTLDVTDTCAAPEAPFFNIPITLANDGDVNEAHLTVHLSTAGFTMTGVACSTRDFDWLCDANQTGQDISVDVTPGTAPMSGSSGTFVQLTMTTDTPCTPTNTMTQTITAATVLDGTNSTIPDVSLGSGDFTCGCPTTTSTTTTTIPPVDAPPLCEGLKSDCYSSFEGVQIGSETRGRGCMNWSEPDKCFFVDRNCNYIFEASNGEVLMCGGAVTPPTCNCDLCVPLGGACTQDIDCCTGVCDGDVCVRCIDIGNPCDANSDCCTGQCVDGNCANSGGSESTTSTSLETTTTTSTSSTTTTTIAFEGFALGACFDVLGLRDDSDLLFPWIAPGTETITSVGCHCLGECASPRATLQLIDGAGNTISLVSTLTCGTGTSATTFVGTDGGDSDRNLVEGERFGIRVTNTPASYDEVTVCVTF